jgi:hypothetical protein
MHHLCTELLLQLAAGLLDDKTLSSPRQNGASEGGPLGMRLTTQDVADLQRIRDTFVSKSVPDLTGVNARGETVRASVHL